MVRGRIPSWKVLGLGPNVDLVMDSMILYLDSVRVGQFDKKSLSESFVQSSSGESNHGMQRSQLSQSDSAPPLFSFSNDRGSRSTIHITSLTKRSGMGGV